MEEDKQGKVIGDILPQTPVWLGLHSIFIPITNLFMSVNEEANKYTGAYNLCNNNNKNTNNNNIFSQDLGHIYMHKK